MQLIRAARRIPAGGLPAGMGIDFRGNAPYVTDPADCIYCLAIDAYPTTRGASLPFGWDTTVGSEDLSTGVDPKLAGDNYRSHSFGAGQYVFKRDFAAAGSKTIRLALGGVGVTNFPLVEARDGVGGTILFTIDDVAGCAAGEFYDANGVKRTSAADWVANNTPRGITLTGTQLVLNFMWQSALGGGRNAIAHFFATP